MGEEGEGEEGRDKTSLQKMKLLSHQLMNENVSSFEHGNKQKLHFSFHLRLLVLTSLSLSLDTLVLTSLDTLILWYLPHLILWYLLGSQRVDTDCIPSDEDWEELLIEDM